MTSFTTFFGRPTNFLGRPGEDFLSAGTGAGLGDVSFFAATGGALLLFAATGGALLFFTRTEGAFMTVLAFLIGGAESRSLMTTVRGGEGILPKYDDEKINHRYRKFVNRTYAERDAFSCK